MFGRRAPSFSGPTADSLARAAARDIYDMKSGQRVPLDVVISEIYEALDFIGYAEEPAQPDESASYNYTSDSDIVAL
jgi:hypothetical protein